MRGVADEELDHARRRGASTSGEPKRSRTVTSALLLGHDQRVREATRARRRRTSAGRRSASRRPRPPGTRMNAPPARNASCSTVNASGDASEHVPSQRPTSSPSHGREAADDDALGRERVVELVVHDPAVAHDDQPGPLTGLGREHAAAGRVLDPDRTDLVRGHRAVRGRGRTRRSGCSARSPRSRVGHSTVGELLGRGGRRSTSQSGPPSARAGCRA